MAAGALLPPAGSPAVCQAKMADSDSDEEIVDTAEFLSEDWVEQVRARAFRSLAAASKLPACQHCRRCCSAAAPDQRPASSQPVAYLTRDLITYAVGIGCDELDFVYEVCSSHEVPLPLPRPSAPPCQGDPSR